MKKLHSFFTILGTSIVLMIFINAVMVADVNVRKQTAETYTIKAIKLPENLNFAGELIPINKLDIRERMDRELLVNTYWQSNGLLLIKRAHKYFPILEPLLKKYNLPDDFKYLAVAESALTNARSYAGASGIWQFMKAAAKEKGLEVNSNVDERYNIELATKAAAEYLKKSKERFGTWTLAAAAYNAGNSRISKELNRQQVNDYYDLLLGSETSRYVFRIVAIKTILESPEAYGFEFDKEDLYTNPNYRKIKIDTPITNIASFAKKYGATYKEFKILNPWLRENKLNNKSRKVYQIKVPSGH